MDNPEIKICGITNIEDALSCKNNNIDCLGFIYFKKSKRFITPEETGEITKKIDRLSFAGVFVDSSIDYVIEAVEKGNLNIVQLHGNESVDYIKKLKSKIDISIIKCLYLNDEPSVNFIDDYNRVCDRFIIEGEKEALPGGNGIKWDYSKVSLFTKKKKIILAGGLNSKNFEEAVMESRCEAYDLSSGVEISPGIKDHKKIEIIGNLKKKISINKIHGRIF